MIMTTLRSLNEAQRLCSPSGEYRITEVFRYLIYLEAPGYVRNPGHQHFYASCILSADSLLHSCTGIHACPGSTQRIHVSRHDVITPFGYTWLTPREHQDSTVAKTLTLRLFVSGQSPNWCRIIAVLHLKGLHDLLQPGLHLIPAPLIGPSGQCVEFACT